MCGGDNYDELMRHQSQVELLGRITDLMKEDYEQWLTEEELEEAIDEMLEEAQAGAEAEEDEFDKAFDDLADEDSD